MTETHDWQGRTIVGTNGETLLIPGPPALERIFALTCMVDQLPFITTNGLRTLTGASTSSSGNHQ